MKGLLLKDFYMLMRYGRSYLLFTLAFLGISLLSDSNAIFIIYPSLTAGLVSTLLITYDDHEKWPSYCATLPVSRAQMVSSKYLISLIYFFAIFVLTVICHGARMLLSSSFVPTTLLTLMLIMFTIGLLGPGMLLPFLFKLGADKGRVVYYIALCLLCVFGFSSSKLLTQSSFTLSYGWLFVVIPLVEILLYAVSWRLSILFYRKRAL